MFQIIVIFLALLSGGPTAQSAAQETVKPLPTIEVTAPKDVASVRAVKDALTALSEKVTACANSGRKPETCQCSYPAELANLRNSYANLLQQHPDWKDQLLSYQGLSKEGRKISGTLVLQNLRRQLEYLKCE